MKITFYCLPNYAKNARAVLPQYTAGALPASRKYGELAIVYFPMGESAHEILLEAGFLNDDATRQNYITVENEGTAADKDPRKYGYFITMISWVGGGSMLKLRFEIDGLYFISTNPTLASYRISNMTYKDGAIAPKLSRCDLAKLPNFDFTRSQIFNRYPIYDSLMTGATYLRDGWVLICRKEKWTDDDAPYNLDEPVNGLYYYLIPLTATQFSVTPNLMLYDDDNDRHILARNYSSIDPSKLNDDKTLFVKWMPYAPFNCGIVVQTVDGTSRTCIVPEDLTGVKVFKFLQGTGVTAVMYRLTRDFYDRAILSITATEIANWFTGNLYKPMPISQPVLVDGNNRVPLLPYHEWVASTTTPQTKSLRLSTRLSINAESQLYFYRTGAGIDNRILYELPMKLDLVEFDLKSDAYLNWLRQNGANFAMSTAMASLGGIAQMIAGVVMANPLLALGGGASAASTAFNAYNTIEKAKNAPDQVTAGRGLMNFAMRLASGWTMPAVVIYEPLYTSYEDWTIAVRVGESYNLTAADLLNSSYRIPDKITITEIVDNTGSYWSDVERAEALSRLGSPMKILSGLLT